jgi:hypothetical protein
MIQTLIAAVVVLLVFIIVTGLSILGQPRQVSYRRVQRSIRRDAKYATKRLRRLERDVRILPPVWSMQDGAGTK